MAEALSEVQIRTLPKHRAKPNEVNKVYSRGCPSFCPVDWYSDMVLALILLQENIKGFGQVPAKAESGRE